MSRFGPNPQAFFADVYQGAAPWDISAAQPALLSLLHDLPPADPILDVGCGSGDLSIALAGLGFTVHGVDFVETAIARARAKAAALAPEVAARVTFGVADALLPARLGRFGAIVDSGFYHLFDQEQSEPFAQELATALITGGRYYLLAFATGLLEPNTPRQVKASELRGRFSPALGWRILDIREAQFLTPTAPVPSIAACIERA
jgi:SAM-dependent methyltransferase